jgi:hypothetical protein
MEILKLKNHPHAKCHVVKDEKFIKFISYETTVIYGVKFVNYENKERYSLWCYGTFSNTTRKQIGYFLNEYFPKLNYQDMKYIFEHDTQLMCDTDGGNKLIIDETKI